MRDTKSVAFAKFAFQIFEVIEQVFGSKVDAGELIKWLSPLASNASSLALLMHDDPLYIAADFLGIDRFSPDFDEIEEKYTQMRRASREHLTGVGIRHGVR